MKKTDCVFYEERVESRRRQTSEDSFDLEPELVDQVCFLDENNPKHHDEYECEGCLFYKKKERQ